MRTRYAWSELVPIDEARLAVDFLVDTWLLYAGHQPDELYFASNREPSITEFLCAKLEEHRATKGLFGFWINENQNLLPANAILASQSGKKPRKRARIRKDISYFCNPSPEKRLELVFEFKKLTKSSLASYRGLNGMRRFVDGYYAKGQPLALMVGRLRDESMEPVDAIYRSLSKPACRMELQMVHDDNNQYIRRPSAACEDHATFDTEHRRPEDQAPPNGTTTLGHIFLHCPV